MAILGPSMMVSIPCFLWQALVCIVPSDMISFLLVSGLIPLNRTLCLFITTQEAEPSEPRSGEVTRKPKAAAPSTNKRPKKEAKKKR